MREMALKEITDRISKLLLKGIDNGYSFHNYDHTLAVVRASFIMAFHHKLNRYDNNVLLLSAWFHDLGYLISIEKHEEISSDYAKDYLSSYGFPSHLIADVQETIISTELSRAPKNILQKILKDADLFHLSQPYFFKVNEKLRREMEFISGKELSKNIWTTKNIDFLKEHKYHSGFGKKYLTESKKRNLELLIRQYQNQNYPPITSPLDKSKIHSSIISFP